MHKSSLCGMVFCGLLAGNLAVAQTANLVDTLRGVQQDGSEGGSFLGDFYGDHVDVDDEWLVVGASRESVDLDGNGDIFGPGERSAGAVYIYRRTASGPVFHQKIEGDGDNELVGDRFGAGVDLGGKWLFIGSSGNNNFPGFVDPSPDPDLGSFNFAGKVYVYRYNGDTDLWERTQELISDVPESGSSFGARTNASHVGLYTFGKNPNVRLALIGEINTINPDKAGKLHVFREYRGEWSRVQIATPPSGRSDTLFADSVTIVRNLALVPENGFDPEADVGQVHVYRLTSRGIRLFAGGLLPYQTVATPSGPSNPVDCNFGRFGSGIGAGGLTVAIADPCDSSEANNSGAVHVYKVTKNGQNPLRFVQTLLNPVPQEGAAFGSSPFSGKQNIAASDDIIAVGSPRFSGPVDEPQDVYVYGRQSDHSFQQTDNIPIPEPAPPDAEGFELYGQSVTLSDDGRLYVSQLGAVLGGGGRVYIFELTP